MCCLLLLLHSLPSAAWCKQQYCSAVVQAGWRPSCYRCSWLGLQLPELGLSLAFSFQYKFTVRICLSTLQYQTCSHFKVLIISLPCKIVPVNFSIFSLIQEMRTQRPSIVQTKVCPGSSDCYRTETSVPPQEGSQQGSTEWLQGWERGVQLFCKVPFLNRRMILQN